MAARQWLKAKERAEALQDDADERIRSAARHQQATREHLRRGAHRDDPNR
jgi:hypothetical protein